MSASREQIDRLRRMTGEPTTTNYDDRVLAAAIERYPLEDARGEGPLVNSNLTPGTLMENPDWTPTYDLNAAAADVWAEKAATPAADFNFSADGGNYSRSQVYEQAMKQSRYYRSRRAVKTITQRPEPLAQGYEEIGEHSDND
jgi:hypothetical protein